MVHVDKLELSLGVMSIIEGSLIHHGLSGSGFVQGQWELNPEYHCTY